MPREQPGHGKGARLRPGAWPKAWAGRPVLVLGGGPSVGKVPAELWRRLAVAQRAGTLGVVGANRAYAAPVRPTVVVSVDLAFWGRVGADPAFKAYDGWALQVRVGDERVAPEASAWVPAAAPGLNAHSWGKGLRTLGTGGNSGYAALNLACSVGASAVWLLGFDGSAAPGWWHEAWPEGPRPSHVYDAFGAALAAGVEHAAREGVPVWNASLGSSHPVPQRPLEELLA